MIRMDYDDESDGNQFILRNHGDTVCYLIIPELTARAIHLSRRALADPCAQIMTVPTFAMTSRADDSDDEGSTSIASGVILAFPDGRVTERTDASTSKLGGSPRFWPCASTAPVAAVSHCGLCGEPMPLVVQLYAPLDDPALGLEREERHRALYVWSCRRKECRSRAERSVVVPRVALTSQRARIPSVALRSAPSGRLGGGEASGGSGARAAGGGTASGCGARQPLRV